MSVSANADTDSVIESPLLWEIRENDDNECSGCDDDEQQGPSKNE